MAFVGPHHGPKILGKNHQSTTKVTLNEPPKNILAKRLTLSPLLNVRNGIFVIAFFAAFISRFYNEKSKVSFQRKAFWLDLLSVYSLYRNGPQSLLIFSSPETVTVKENKCPNVSFTFFYIHFCTQSNSG